MSNTIVHTFSAAGPWSDTVPSNTTQINIVMWGGGGPGSNGTGVHTGWGGGSGGYLSYTTASFTIGETLSGIVGSFPATQNTTCTQLSLTAGTGSAGSGAGTGGTGGAGGTSTGGTINTTGTTGTSSGGGNAPNGGAGGSPGIAGQQPGGGGGGGTTGSGPGQNGGIGQVIITYTVSSVGSSNFFQFF